MKHAVKRRETALFGAKRFLANKYLSKAQSPLKSKLGAFYEKSLNFGGLSGVDNGKYLKILDKL